jgi:hypothetical protein
VKAVDEAGKVVLDRRLKTLKNGFFEIWLPRWKIFEVTVTGLNRSATEAIPTMDNSRTCVTTMQLK